MKELSYEEIEQQKAYDLTALWSKQLNLLHNGFDFHLS